MRRESEIGGLTVPRSTETGEDIEMLGLRVRHHHTVYRPSYRKTYGGLHRDRAGAERARQLLVEQHKVSAVLVRAFERAVIIDLVPG